MNGRRVALYARVSTADQDCEMQLRDLRAYTQARGWEVAEFIDNGVSGAKTSRPELNRMLDAVRKRRVDGILVWRLDRLCRNTRHLLEIFDEAQSVGATLTSFQENIDTSGPMGKAVVTILGAIAELERATICERVRAGIARAKSEGRHCGRPRVWVDIGKAKALRAEGQSYRAIGAALGVSHSTVAAVLSVQQG